MATTPSAADTVRDALSRFRAGESIVPEAKQEAPLPPPKPVDTSKMQRATYRRQNGEVYYAKGVPGAEHDVAMLRECRGMSLLDNLYVLAYGKPGAGKNALFEAAFPDILTVSCNRDTEMDAFLGTWVQMPDGSYEWVFGPFAIAAMEGRPVHIEEIAVCPPQVITDLYSSMDGQGVIRIKANPRLEPIKIQPGFWVGGSCNPDAPGALMSDALLSRFSVHMECTTDYDLAEEVGVPKKFVKIARNLAEKAASDKVVFVPQMRELMAAKRATEKFGMEFAASNLVGSAPANDRPVVADVASRVLGYAVFPLRQGDAVRVPISGDADSKAGAA